MKTIRGMTGIAAMLLLAVPLSLLATEYVLPESMPMLEEVDPTRYIVGPGDVLWFSVHGGIPGEDINGILPGLMEVTPDGYAVLPSVGAWKVSGLTLSEAASMIERGFSSRLPGMSGSAGLARMRRFQVPVTGHVANPGIVVATGADGLVKVLAAAGGVASSGSMTRVHIIGPGGDTARVDITEFLRTGDMRANPYLALGDRVHVPEAEDHVLLEGALNLSGSMAVSLRGVSDEMVWNGSVRGMTEFIPGETVSGLLSRTGGTAPWAVRDSCYVLRASGDRAGTRLPAPLDDPGIDPELLPGDLVVCPGTPPLVTVAGEVHSPGVYPHTAGMNAFFYVSQAGGYIQSSSRSGTRVVLPGGEEVKPDELHSVPAGAAVTVPRKALVGWQDPLLILTSVASIVIAWKSIF